MKKLFALILCLCLVLGLGGCELPGEDPAVRESVELILEAIRTDDPEMAIHRIDPETSDASQFASSLQQIRSTFGSFEAYTLTFQGFYIEVTNGNTVRRYTYQLKSEGSVYRITVTDSGENTLLTGFQIREIKGASGEIISGNLATLGKASTMQLLLLAVWLLEVAFMVWMATDCIRRKDLKHKWLWLLLLWFVTVEPSVSVGNGSFVTNYRLAIHLIPSLTSLLKYASGTVRFQLMVPMGAILYFLLRKKLTEVPSANAPTEASPEESPEPPGEQE